METPKGKTVEQSLDYSSDQIRLSTAANSYATLPEVPAFNDQTGQAPKEVEKPMMKRAKAVAEKDEASAAAA